MLQACHDSQPGKNSLIALGSNVASRQGGPEETIEKALAALDGGVFRLRASSPLYRTPCFPVGAGPDYINAVARVETALSPAQILAELHRIETEFDRVRRERWASRTLDLDLLIVDQNVLPDQPTLQHWVDLPAEAQTREAPDQLILPHPRLQDRGFVLVPAADVWPDWRHPLTGLSIAEMRDGLPAAELAGIVPVAG